MCFHFTPDAALDRDFELEDVFFNLNSLISLKAEKEDNVINQQVARELLEQAGLSALEEMRFDLVLTDIHMPVMEGRQFHEMAALAHGLKGVSGSLGAHDPMGAATALERTIEGTLISWRIRFIGLKKS